MRSVTFLGRQNLDVRKVILDICHARVHLRELFCLRIDRMNVLF